jgi:hypothetical protein
LTTRAIPVDVIPVDVDDRLVIPHIGTGRGDPVVPVLARLSHPPRRLTRANGHNTASRSMKLSDLEIKLFTDGADKAQIVEMAKQPWIRGFTTNPSLLKKAGVSDYEAYARDLVAAVPDRHISFEVFSDDIPEMIAQARKIASWGGNVYVKLPVTNQQF